MLISGTRRGLTPKLVADLRRRSAIEPEIGHMKSDGRLARCPLKGTIGPTGACEHVLPGNGCLLRGAVRLRPQHPKDPCPPQGTFVPHHCGYIGCLQVPTKRPWSTIADITTLFRIDKVDFRGEKRSNATHVSTTDPNARLYKKFPGSGAMLCFIGGGGSENDPGDRVPDDGPHGEPHRPDRAG